MMDTLISKFPFFFFCRNQHEYHLQGKKVKKEKRVLLTVSFLLCFPFKQTNLIATESLFGCTYITPDNISNYLGYAQLEGVSIDNTRYMHFLLGKGKAAVIPHLLL